MNTLAGGFGFASFRSIDGLAQRGKALASDAFTRCVALDTRVRVGSELRPVRLSSTAIARTVRFSAEAHERFLASQSY